MNIEMVFRDCDINNAKRIALLKNEYATMIGDLPDADWTCEDVLFVASVNGMSEMETRLNRLIEREKEAAK